ncbi:SanA/YdcF family protein [Dactylosporangium matsuzakiense]|uniref:Membrane protein n=1 Tax=Dactylosporangium matsuzakiense TaxID=53360 RepID=A0A9W6NPZ6_9ACTN|nr:ElyC/SanA/YdcF family protein [Dactylosporangium matsuzakiense]UWZ43671.1 YdcF family protein [Dactylosporangium matsuzakiense]GLL04572.1 membrane protein [Dactylosporangium matsuzakiense]
MSTPPAVKQEQKPLRWYRRRRVLLRLSLSVIVVAAIALTPTVWVRVMSSGRLVAVADAPTADVAIVFGAEVAPGGQEPKPFLRNRLDTAATLVTTGKVKALLISGDAQGSSGNEVRVMGDYLSRKGVEPSRVVVDPYGLDTYDTCRRAHDVYGVRRALLVSQDLHLYRAVTLCRDLGVDAWGVPSGCAGCRTLTIWKNQLRDVAAAWKAAWDATTDRPPAVVSPADPTLQQAIDAHTP